MWEEVARQIALRGGRIHLRQRIVGIERKGVEITAVIVQDQTDGSVQTIPCAFLISTMPVRDLTAMLKPSDDRVIRIADRLPYRDFMTAGLLLRKMNRTDARGRDQRHAPG